MEVTLLHIESGDPMDILMRYLEGRVFHVTKACNWHKIKASGEIRPNTSGTLESSFGFHPNSYFLNKGCVSVFDYRKIDEEKPQEHMNKCLPTNPLSHESSIVIFLLKPEICSKLQLWEEWKNGHLTQMIVPHVEAGHLGPIPLSLVERVLVVTKAEVRDSFASRLRSTTSGI